MRINNMKNLDKVIVTSVIWFSLIFVSIFNPLMSIFALIIGAIVTDNIWETK